MNEWMAVVRQLTTNGAAELPRRPSGADPTSDNFLPREAHVLVSPQGISCSEALPSTSVTNTVVVRPQTPSLQIG